MNWELGDLLRQYVAKYPISQYWSDSQYRLWVKGFAEQAAYSVSPSYGTKSSSPNSPQSADVIAFMDGMTGKLYGWDIVVSAGDPNATVNFTPETLDITGQFFIPVVPINHLGSSTPTPIPPTPTPTPVPIPDLTEVLELLKNYNSGLSKLNDDLIATDQRVAAIRELLLDVNDLLADLASSKWEGHAKLGFNMNFTLSPKI